jgi:hypothetical protein
VRRFENVTLVFGDVIASVVFMSRSALKYSALLEINPLKFYVPHFQKRWILSVTLYVLQKLRINVSLMI